MIFWRALTILFLVGTGLDAQNRVDFKRDVQPIFKQYCIDCHGPSQQMNGLRLDRRSDAMKGGTVAVIGRGNAAGSRLYLRVSGGSSFGTRMPPTGPLKDEQIRTIRDWIDQGAEWPDDAAGDPPRTIADPTAMRLLDSLRNRDRDRLRRLVNADRGMVNRKGTGGDTPLMYAALYGDVAALRLLLDAGADVNAHNDAGATALIWALPDLEKTTLLLDHGADVNARSDDARTPLLIAASWRGSSTVLKLLLGRGAKVAVESPRGANTPLGRSRVPGGF